MVPVPNPVLFDAPVAQHTVLFDPAAGAALVERLTGLLLPESLARAVPKRQAEFLAGRHCAREALRRCAPDLAQAPLPIGPRREPVWPPGIVGTITHAAGIASAAVARADQVRGLGLDIEDWMDDARAERLQGAIAAQAELAPLLGATGAGLGRVLTAVFSAKEAIYKCLYPEVRRYFGFLDAWVDRLDFTGGRFEAHLVQSLAPGLPEGERLEGRVASAAERVTTGLWLPARRVG